MSHPPFQAPQDAFTGVSAARFGLYLHCPYCLAKCPYCDFAVAVARVVPEERYAAAVLAELDLRLQERPELRGRRLESVFLGGGTPSLWHPRHVARVLEGLHARLPFAPGLEVSLEANPSVADAERYAGYRAAGVNRLSLGVQSFQPETLKALGRDHDAAQAEGAFRAARAARFESVSLDFIYGVHGQSLAQVRSDAERAAALQPEHLSTYALTVEREQLAEDTPLAKQLARGQLHLPPDEVVVDMARAVREAYEARGLARYEISNHARPGHSSRPNALYWTGGEYLALGVGATGTVGGQRYSNDRSAERYLRRVESGELPVASSESLGARELFEERFSLGLRLRGGVDWEPLLHHYGEDPGPRRAEVARLVAHGLATLEGHRLTLTDAGADVHSEVCARLL